MYVYYVMERSSFLSHGSAGLVRHRPMSSTSKGETDSDQPDTSGIEVSLGKRGGEPVFRGTRIPIAYLSQYLNHGYTVEDFIEEYDVDPELVWKVYREKFSDGGEQGRRVPA